MKYLLDTDICIFFLQNKFGMVEKIDAAGQSNCYISFMTIVELKYGAENSDNPNKHRQEVEQFMQDFQVIPLGYDIADTFAKEKARLRKAGTPIDSFDLLIGSTALTKDLIIITGNQKHFSKIKDIQIDNWIAGKR